MKQLLHLVVGGDLVDPQSVEFRDLKQMHFVGAFPNYAEAYDAWKGAAQSTVDNAIRRYFILHAHKLIDPGVEEQPKKVKRYRVWENSGGEWCQLGAEFSDREGETYVSFKKARDAALEHFDYEFGIDDSFRFEWTQVKEHELGPGWYTRTTEIDGWEDEDITYFITEIEL